MPTKFPFSRAVPLESVFKALGHPARLRIVRELMDGEKCVCELVDTLELAWSTVSRHLAVLREAAVLAEDKRGSNVFYRLELRSVANFINYFENPAFRAKVDAFVDSIR